MGSGEVVAAKEEPRRDWRVIIATALAASLIPAAAGWVTVQSKTKEAQVDLDRFGAYIIDRMQRDEALEAVLLHCLDDFGSPAAQPDEATLDDVAALGGYVFEQERRRR